MTSWFVDKEVTCTVIGRQGIEAIRIDTFAVESWTQLNCSHRCSHGPDQEKRVAAFLLQPGSDIRTVQGLLGHADVATTMAYTHVLKVGGMGARSPLDALLPVG